MKNTDKQTLRYETITKSPEFLKAAENNKKSGVFYLALRVKPKTLLKLNISFVAWLSAIAAV